MNLNKLSYLLHWVIYHVKPKEIDIGKNLFGVAQVDYGLYSFIIVPFILLFIFVLLSNLIKITSEFPTFSWLLTGNIIFYLINIEENGNEIFFMFRNIIILLIILVGCLIVRKLYFRLSLTPRKWWFRSSDKHEASSWTFAVPKSGD